MATMEHDFHQNTSSVNENLLGMQQKHKVLDSDVACI